MLPPFARLEEPAAGGVRSIAVEGAGSGAVAQMLERPGGAWNRNVVAVGYARVESAHPIQPADEDITPRLWEGAVALVNGYQRWRGGFESPHVQLRFTGRQAASGEWKRFVSPPTAVWRARKLYPHFAFWETRFAPGVRIHVAALALVPAEAADPECPDLPAPQPVLETVSSRQWDQDWKPDGTFEGVFELAEQPAGVDVDLHLRARYRQGANRADRFLVAVTQDGSDPRLSSTSRVETILARRGAEQWETTLRVPKGAGPVRIAVAAAAVTSGGLRVQTALFPPAWQKPGI
jgi:hypothetical protein